METTGFGEPHPDVTWVEVPSLPKNRRANRAADPETDDDEAVCSVLRESKAHPGVIIDRSHGRCGCWLCTDKPVSYGESGWMFRTIAKHALSLPELDRDAWLRDWSMRHGKFALAILNRHIDWINTLNGASRA